MKQILTALLLLAASVGNAAPLNTELVINGGAESGDMTGWLSGGIDAVAAVGDAAGFGDFVFTGSTGPATQTATQSIDLSGNAAAIDAGQATSIFSIYLQGRTQGGFTDTAEVIVTYRNGANGQLGAFAFTDTSTAVHDWDFFSDTRAVPVGTRSIDIFLRTARPVGDSSDGFFDEVSLQLTAVPLPAGLWLALSGLVAMARISRRG